MKSSDDIQTLFDANRNKTKLLRLGAPLHNDGQALRIITLIWVISVWKKNAFLASFHEYSFVLMMFKKDSTYSTAKYTLIWIDYKHKGQNMVL